MIIVQPFGGPTEHTSEVRRTDDKEQCRKFQVDFEPSVKPLQESRISWFPFFQGCGCARKPLVEGANCTRMTE